MSGSYAQNFSPARALSPHLRTPPDVDSQYLTELLAEHQKLGPFAQVVPICGRLLNQEIIRVSGMMPNQGFSDFDRLQRGSPSPIGSDIMPKYRVSGLGGWNGRPHDVETLRHSVAYSFCGLEDCQNILMYQPTALYLPGIESKCG